MENSSLALGSFIFQDRKFRCGSEALEAYVNQSAGKKWRRKLKYRRDLLELICNSNSESNPGPKAKQERLAKAQEIASAVLDQLHRPNVKQDPSTSASAKLDERLQRERARSADHKQRSHANNTTRGAPAPTTRGAPAPTTCGAPAPTHVTETLTDKLMPPTHLAQVEKLLALVKDSITSFSQVPSHGSRHHPESSAAEQLNRLGYSQDMVNNNKPASNSFPAYEAQRNAYGISQSQPGKLPTDLLHVQAPSTPGITSAYTPALSTIPSDAGDMSIISGHMRKAAMSTGEGQGKMSSTPKKTTWHTDLCAEPHNLHVNSMGYNAPIMYSQPAVERTETHFYHPANLPTYQTLEQQRLQSASVEGLWPHGIITHKHLQQLENGFNNYSQNASSAPAPPQAMYAPGPPPFMSAPYHHPAESAPPSLFGRTYGMVPAHDVCWADTRARHQRYEVFLSDLMKDIDKAGAGSRSQEECATPASTNHNPADVRESTEEGIGFLQRVKTLLASEPPAGGTESCSTPGSDSVKELLEGRKPWKDWEDFFVRGSGIPQSSVTHSDKFITECVSEGQKKPYLEWRAPTFNDSSEKKVVNSDPSSHQSSMSLNESVAGLLSEDVRQLLSKTGRQQTENQPLARAMHHLGKMKALMTPE